MATIKMTCECIDKDEQTITNDYLEWGCDHLKERDCGCQSNPAVREKYSKGYKAATKQCEKWDKEIFENLDQLKALEKQSMKKLAGGKVKDIQSQEEQIASISAATSKRQARWREQKQLLSKKAKADLETLDAFQEKFLQRTLPSYTQTINKLSVRAKMPQSKTLEIKRSLSNFCIKDLTAIAKYLNILNPPETKSELAWVIAIHLA